MNLGRRTNAFKVHPYRNLSEEKKMAGGGRKNAAKTGRGQRGQQRVIAGKGTPTPTKPTSSFVKKIGNGRKKRDRKQKHSSETGTKTPGQGALLQGGSNTLKEKNNKN